MLDFEVALRSAPACAVVVVQGELDIATAPRLVTVLDEAAQANAARIVVDLLDTTFIDSTGLTSLFRAHKQCVDAGGEFCLVCGADNLEVRRVIELMGFDTVFSIHETLAAAGCDEEPAAS